MKPKAEDIKAVFRDISRKINAPKWVEEEGGIDTSPFAMSWQGDCWYGFRWIADVIAEREGVSRGVAERTLRELCATGDVRSIRYHTITDEEQEPEIIRPSEWVKDQVDLADDILIWIFVSAGDVQYWLDKQATEAGRPLKRLSLQHWIDELGEEPKEAAEPVLDTKARASRKLTMARTAISDLWPQEQKPPEELTNPQIEKQVDEWITSYCKKNNLPKPDIGRDTILRAAGRRQ
jgi:hypothetical protein